GGAAAADRKRAVGQGGRFCQGRAGIAGGLADDAAADGDGRVFRVGIEATTLNLRLAILPAVIARSPCDEAIHSFFMLHDGLLRFARNDVLVVKAQARHPPPQSTIKIFAPVFVDERCAASPWSDTW